MQGFETVAWDFFEACESGKGWAVCQAYCLPNASFSAQAGALGGVQTLEQYTEWMKGMLTFMPDGHYELKSFAVDEKRNNASAYATFHGTHTGSGGPCPPTGKKTATDYVYVMHIEGDKISNMTKIWNDSLALKELGWV